MENLCNDKYTIIKRFSSGNTMEEEKEKKNQMTTIL